jgi:predicted secreted protein
MGLLPQLGLSAELALGFGFAILAIAVITWIVVLIRELPEGDPTLNNSVRKITSIVFDAAPAQSDIKRSSLPVRIIVEGIIPIIFWLLIIVPMVVFPIILILMVLFHIPWTYLLPVPP